MVSARAALMVMGLLGSSLFGCTLRTAPPPESAEDRIEAPEDIRLSGADRARIRAYMRAIEARAKRRHIDVYWVNPPDRSARADLDQLQLILDGQPPYPRPAYP